MSTKHVTDEGAGLLGHFGLDKATYMIIVAKLGARVKYTRNEAPNFQRAVLSRQNLVAHDRTCKVLLRERLYQSIALVQRTSQHSANFNILLNSVMK